MTKQECIDDLVGKLKEAQSAYHQLQIGGSARVIKDQNGEAVEYTATNRQGLYIYIQTLLSQLKALGWNDACCQTQAAGTRPMSFIF